MADGHQRELVWCFWLRVVSGVLHVPVVLGPLALQLFMKYQEFEFVSVRN